jgi:hypothetical protein
MAFWWQPLMIAVTLIDDPSVFGFASALFVCLILIAKLFVEKFRFCLLTCCS